MQQTQLLSTDDAVRLMGGPNPEASAAATVFYREATSSIGHLRELAQRRDVTGERAKVMLGRLREALR